MPDQITAEQAAIIKELSGRGDLNPEQQAIVSELMNRIGGQQPEPPMSMGQPQIEAESPQSRLEQIFPKEGEMGPADYLRAIWEGYKGGASMLAQAAAEPVAGMAGFAKTITSGPEAGAQTIEEIRSAAANLIPSEVAQESIRRGVGAAMEVPGVAPTVEFASKIPENIGDLTYEGALGLGLSPDSAAYFGAAGKSAIPVAVELMGLKGTKAAKKGLLRRVIEKENKAGFYNEVGELIPEMKTALREADIGLEEVKDFLPETITTQKAAKPIAEQIKKVPSRLGIGESARMSRLAETFQPDIDKIKAFEELGVDFLPQHISNNPTAAAIAENLKDIPGSLMADREKRIVEQLADKADEIIKQGGGTIEKGELATRYIDESQNVINELAKSSEKLYQKVGKAMPGKTAVDTENIITLLKNRADDLNGEQFLSAQEKRLLKTLDMETGPTYARLDQARRQIGEQLGGTDTVFRNVDRKTLGEMYDALTNDQETALLRHGNQDLLETYLAGKHTTAQRKGIENQLKDTLGKKLTGDITKKMGAAVKGLSTGDTRTFDNLLSNIPKEVGQEIRQDLVTSALNDAFLAGARGKDKLSIGGFGSFWKKLNRQPAAMNRLKNELTPETWKRLNTLATVNDALKQTMELSVKTGRQLSTPGLFDEVNSIAKRAYGVAKQKAGAIPGFGALRDIVTVPKNARSIAADELLSDRRFQNLLKQYAVGKADTPKKVANLDRIIKNLKTYKNWEKTLPPSTVSELATVTALGYLMSPQQQEPAQ